MQLLNPLNVGKPIDGYARDLQSSLCINFGACCFIAVLYTALPAQRWRGSISCLIWPQAIDLMDEAGSRVRIRAYHARQPGGTADALAAVKELHEVQDAKAQAVKVRCMTTPAADSMHCTHNITCTK